MRWRLILALVALICFAPVLSWAQDDDPMPDSGIVTLEVGVWRVLGGERSLVNDPVMIYINTAFSIQKEFGLSEDVEAIRIGPKLGFGIGSARGESPTNAFYDFILKVRYTFLSPETYIRPYLDFGPGVVSYRRTAFQLEGGAGANLYFPVGTLGVSLQYKEVLGNRDVKRGLAFLGTIGYAF